MIDQGLSTVVAPSLTWRLADALALPFSDGAFDAVACQFGVMFFLDKLAGYREASRVLAPGGRFLFSAWDRLAANEYALIIHEAVAACFPADPPDFLKRTLFSHHGTEVIDANLKQAGFGGLLVETVSLLGHARSHHDPAIGLCQGSPLKSEIESRQGPNIDEVTEKAATALEERFGTGPIDVQLQAHVITAYR